jgi:acetyltransferase-like isoleucine patch superfamily enzyme
MSKGSTFKKFEKIIQLLVWLNSFFPKKINKFFLVIFRNLPTKFGILVRYILLKNICIELGKNVIVHQSVIFDAPEMMIIGNDVSINPFCYLAGEITIGNNVSIAHTTAIHSFNHTWNDLTIPIRNNKLYTKRVIIKDDIWIACNCIILSGVEIGNRVVVAAGTIVNKSVERNSLVGGNPAKLLKKI